jgi:hypothetical protein
LGQRTKCVSDYVVSTVIQCLMFSLSILDVLFGRGTGSNMHSGNINFRALIQRYKTVYRDTPKNLKPSVSTKVVAVWRAQDPPGRFLSRSDRLNGTRRAFYDVGDVMARRKAAQCLREKSSVERMETQNKSSGGKRAREEEDEDEERQWEPPTTPYEATIKDEVLFPEVADAWTSTNLSDELLGIVSTRPDRTHSKAPPCSSTNFSSELDMKKTMDTIFLQSRTPLGSNGAPDLGGHLKFKLLANYNKADTLLVAAHQQDKAVLSLMDIYAAESDESVGDLLHKVSSDSPFIFASLDKRHMASADDDDDDNGLCFPSLFAGNTAEKRVTTLSSVLGDDEDDVLPSLENLAHEVPDKQGYSLQTIRDTMPTAAMLTTGLFDF